MIRHNIIEEHPRNEPAPWVANAVLAPKDNGTIRVTVDARKVNKPLHSTNYSILRHENI